MSCVIWWIRRDLRLSDNFTLQAALENNCEIVPLFILDRNLLKFSPIRNSFLFSCLIALDKSLRARGSRLILRTGSPKDVFYELQAETLFTRIYAQNDYSPYSLKRDKEVGRSFPLTQVFGLTIYPPGMVLKPDGSPYQKYTPYRNNWSALPREERKTSIPDRFPACPDIPSDLLPESKPSSVFPPEENFARERLEDYAKDDIYHYSLLRNRMDLDKTSRISPYLKFGLISIHAANQIGLMAIEQAQNSEEKINCQMWMNELIWREFYYQIMFNHPYVLHESFNPSMRMLPWNDSENDFNAWQTGTTGYPIVDAGMRQLNQTGWMHNRARMITASFLVKDLLINWQRGENYFRNQLIDYDPASNNGGWQWIAGTGTDSVPYFRIFNPILQSKKFDPDGLYIRKFLPELAYVPIKYIHTPWLMPLDIQEVSKCTIGKQYPKPIVDYVEAKKRTLQVYRSLNH